MLQGLDGRFVIDKTGFDGLIDIPSQTLDLVSFKNDLGPSAIAASVWQEVLRLLGMKLERTQAPIQVLTIDGISKLQEI